MNRKRLATVIVIGTIAMAGAILPRAREGRGVKP
jgi:hypothetical protein